MKRIIFSLPWFLDGPEMRQLFSYAFYVALMSYVGFALLENLRPGFVHGFFNENIFLWVTIVTGIMATIWPMIVPAAKKNAPPRWSSYLWIVVVAALIGGLVWYKTSTVGWMAEVFAPLSGLLVLGLGVLVYLDREEVEGSSDE